MKASVQATKFSSLWRLYMPVLILFRCSMVSAVQNSMSSGDMWQRLQLLVLLNDVVVRYILYRSYKPGNSAPRFNVIK